MFVLCWNGLARFGFGALFQRGFTRKFYASLIIDADALDPNLVANLDDIFGLLDAEVREFADVDEAIPARQEFHEGAEFFDRDHFAAVNFSGLRFGGSSVKS